MNLALGSSPLRKSNNDGVLLHWRSATVLFWQSDTDRTAACPPRAGGERVAKASPSLASHHAHGQGRDAPAFACMTGGPDRCVANLSYSKGRCS